MKMKSKSIPNSAYFKLAIFFTKSLLIVSTSVLFGWYLFPNFIHLQIGKKMVISPEQSPEYYSMWAEPPVPIYFKAYLFNVSNPEEIEAGMRPIFKEIGPYIFQEFRKKVDVSLDDLSDSATYKDHVRYEFRKEMSGNLSLEDVVTIINVPYAAAAIQIERDVPWPLNHVAHMILLNYKEPLFVQKTVQEALFKGWKVPFLDKLEEEIGFKFLKNNTFGFFVDMNDTAQGPYTIKRGLHGDKELFGRMLKYKDEPQLPFWGDKNTSCNKLKGTDGFIFPPFITKDSVLFVFSSELCGSADFIYSKDVVVEGVHGYRFTLSKTAMASARDNVEARCFCKNIDEEPEKCLGGGTLDLGACRDGAPVALSTPHFLDADPMYLQQIGGGIKPDREKHQPLIDIEPLSGLVIRASKRVQLNLILSRVGSIPSMRKVKEMLFPCVWAEEGGGLDEPSSEQLKTILFILNLADKSAKFIALFSAVLISILLYRKQFAARSYIDKDNSCDKSGTCKTVDPGAMEDDENCLNCCGDDDDEKIDVDYYRRNL